MATPYLPIIKWGRLLAKVLRIENCRLVKWVHVQILARAFKPNAVAPIVRYWDHDFVVAPDLSMLPGLLNQTYEFYELELVESSLEPGQVFYDIGANFGLYSVLASKCVGHGGRVYAFEPAPATFLLLEENTRTLGNVTLFNAAVGNAVSEAVLNVDESNAGCSSLLKACPKTGTAVSVVSIDSLYHAGRIKRADFVKIDVEGFEEEVLQGLFHAIDQGTMILCKYNPTFLSSVGRNPQAFLDFVHRHFEEVSFVSELTGRLKAIARVEDLNGQLVSNLVLRRCRLQGAISSAR